MGRKKQHSDNAARQRAYRERKRNAQAEIKRNRYVTPMQEMAERNGISRSTQLRITHLGIYRPDLLERLRRDELSAKAATIAAGWEDPILSVVTTDPDRALAQLLRYYEADELIDTLCGAIDDAESGSPETLSGRAIVEHNSKIQEYLSYADEEDDHAA